MAAAHGFRARDGACHRAAPRADPLVAPRNDNREIRPRMFRRSREAMSSEVCCVSRLDMRGGGAPIGARVLARHPSRANRVGPQALARRLAPHNAGCSPLGAPHRRLLAPSPPGRDFSAVHSRAARFGLASVRSHVPLVVAGGRVFPVASRVLLARQRAGRRSRSDSGSSPETPLVNGTRTRIGANARASNESGAIPSGAVGKLSIAERRQTEDARRCRGLERLFAIHNDRGLRLRRRVGKSASHANNRIHALVAALCPPSRA
jgi:hypothetical protein